MRKLIIVGAGGHGKVVADVALHCGYEDIAFLDDDNSVKNCMDFPVIGNTEDMIKYADADFFVAVETAQTRELLMEKLMTFGLHVVTLVHPEADIAIHVEIGKGTIVMPGTAINPDTTIGMGCIINTGATVDHDCIVEDYANISVGAHIAGNVKVGSKTWVGIGAVVNDKLTICADCMIGAGAVIVKDINEKGTYIGLPAKKAEL